MANETTGAVRCDHCSLPLPVQPRVEIDIDLGYDMTDKEFRSVLDYPTRAPSYGWSAGKGYLGF